MQKLVFFQIFFAFCWQPTGTSQRINDLCGINANGSDPVTEQLRFTWVRSWHDWSDDIGYRDPRNQGANAAYCINKNTPTEWQLKFNPSYNQGGAFLNYDAYYAQLKSRCIPVLKGVAPRLRGYSNYDGFCVAPNILPLEQKPTCPTTEYVAAPTPPNSPNCFLPSFSLLPTNGEQEFYGTYEQHALWMSLFVAKYYGATYPTAWWRAYMTDGIEARLPQGYNLLRYIEDNNEPNKIWYDNNVRAANNLPPVNFATEQTYFYFSPSQFAAMTSADYDGHKGEIKAFPPLGQQTLGVTNAANNVKYVLGGLSGLNGAYFKDMQTKWDQIRGANNRPSFVANFHHYCTDVSSLQASQQDFVNGEYNNYAAILINTGGANTPSGHGVSPEKDMLREKLSWLAGKQNTDGVNGTERWLSEFGYDTYPAVSPNNSGVEAPQIAGPDGPYDPQKVQGQWLVRGVLEAAASKAIDKMMLYELRDHDSGAGTNYDFSGLLTEAGAAKRSWFYVMTLKNVLGEYFFEKDLTIDENFIIKTVPTDQKIRVYQFAKNLSDANSDRILAIWSPTQDAVVPFKCSVTYPEDGPSFTSAILVEIEEMNEQGRQTDYLSNISNNGKTISEIPVSETPVFVRLGKAYRESLLTPPVIAEGSLAAESTCCGAVRLQWAQKGFSRNTLVYYRKGSDCTQFDPTQCVLFSNNTGPNRTSIMITGLEKGETYCFFVFPIAYNGSPQASATISTTVSISCDGCFIDITDAEIGIDPGLIGNAITDLRTQLNNLLGVGRSKDCEDLLNTAKCGAQNWTLWNTPNANAQNPNTFFINFQSPQYIDAVYAGDGTGSGRIIIEYKDCECPGWRHLTSLNLTGSAAINSLITLSNLPAVPIRALRITKVNQDAVICRLWFCGRKAACSNLQDGFVGTPTDLRPDEIRQNSALLRWQAAEYVQGKPEAGYVENYELLLSQNVTAQGELADPEIISVAAESYEIDGRWRIDGLAPGTLYYVELRLPSPGPCSVNGTSEPLPNPAPARTSFVTDTDKKNDKSEGREYKERASVVESAFHVHLAPNPATQSLQVWLDKGNIQQLEVFGLQGSLMLEVSNIGAEKTILNLEKINGSGFYWLRLTRTDGSRQTVPFMRS